MGDQASPSPPTDPSNPDIMPTVYAGIFLSRPCEDGSGLHWLMQRSEGGGAPDSAGQGPEGGAGQLGLQRFPTLTAATQAATAALNSIQGQVPLASVARSLAAACRSNHGCLPLAASLPMPKPAKRKRGRPRKHPLPAEQQPVLSSNDLLLEEPCDRYIERFRRALRGQTDLASETACPQYTPEQTGEEQEAQVAEHAAMHNANKALRSAAEAAAREAVSAAGSHSAWTADMLLVGTPPDMDEAPQGGSEAAPVAIVPPTPAVESQGMTVPLEGGTPVVGGGGGAGSPPMQPTSTVPQAEAPESKRSSTPVQAQDTPWWQAGGLRSPLLSPAQRLAWLVPSNPRLVHPQFANAVTGVDPERVKVCRLAYTQGDVKRRRTLRKQLDCALALSVRQAEQVTSNTAAAHNRAAYTQMAKHLVADARHQTSACLLPMNLHMASAARSPSTPHYLRTAPQAASAPPSDVQEVSADETPVNTFQGLDLKLQAASSELQDGSNECGYSSATPPRGASHSTGGGVKRPREWSSSRAQPGNGRAHDGPVFSAQHVAALYVPPHLEAETARPASAAAAAAAAAAAWRRSMAMQDPEGGPRVGDRGAHYARLGMIRAAKHRGLQGGAMRMVLPATTSDRTVKIQGLSTVAFSTTLPAVAASVASSGAASPTVVQGGPIPRVDEQHPAPAAAVSGVASAGEPSSLRGSSGTSPQLSAPPPPPPASTGEDALLPQRVPRHIAQEADRSAAYAVALANSSRRKVRPKRVFVHSMAVSELDVKVEVDAQGTEVVHFSVPPDYLNVKDELSSRNRLSKTAIIALKSWMMKPENWRSPYPDDRTRRVLAGQLGLNETQVANWFRNERKRIWLPMKRRALAAVQQARASAT